MRILGLGDNCELGELYRRLGDQGHEIKVWARNAPPSRCWTGLLDFVEDWEAAIPWLKQVGGESLAIFETAGMGTLQDQLRDLGIAVIGGSAYGDRLESDREFGQSVLREVGLPTAPCRTFKSYQEGIEFVRLNPGRYVLKNNGADVFRSRNFVSTRQDGADLLCMLAFHESHHDPDFIVDFLLMDFIQGVEVGVGAYFNGCRFLRPACLDWEHKHFFPSELGELTGEMGTVVTFEGSTRIFEQSLAKMEKELARHDYCGYINLNLIANAEGLWPLEFTSRFGYPGYAICEALQETPWDALFKTMVNGGTDFKVRAGWAVGIVLTVPPFPYPYGYDQISRGLPVDLSPHLDAKERGLLHLGDIARENGRIVMSGQTGYVGVATGVGRSVKQAKMLALELAQKVSVPNMRYRTDIGQRVMNDITRLREWGYLDSFSLH